MVQLFNGTMVQWYNGTMVQWYNGTIIQLFNGTMVQWYNYSIIQWYNAGLIKILAKIAYLSFLLVPKMFFYFVSKFFRPRKGISNTKKKKNKIRTKVFDLFNVAYAFLYTDELQLIG